ncbi:LysR substrate-binding domain-containing protein [Pseudonocardia spinosispora]|uniref:LysR substrate-binding domain-containing protein n=1 Tax=Pseudonocardia spinosispora TaxID=103441 RepID=UPI0005682ACE|nr:LysR substrate-binding domain-containing protein [Pseudonocardia spinosispora]
MMLQHLSSFVAVAEELHFGRAATRLSMTQPPLSRRIHLLERELGVELFDRSQRSIRLTPAGRSFLADARAILQLSQQAALSVRKVPGGQVGRVTMAFTATTAYTVLDSVVTACTEHLPGVDLVLREMVSATQIEALLAGQIDLGLVRPPVANPEIATREVLREPLLAALPTTHPLARQDADPTLADFDGQPFIMHAPSEARYFYEVLVGIFRMSGVSPVYTQYISQSHTILALVRAGVGVSLVPAAAAALHFEGVVLRPVTGLPARPVELHVMWRPNNENPALHALLPLVRVRD